MRIAKNHVVFSLIVALTLLGCNTEPSTAADPAASWPSFHGPNHDNKSTETGLLKQWPDGGPKLLWTCKGLGEGFSGVAIADGRILTTGNVNDQSTVFGIDMNGTIRWSTATGPAWDKSFPGTRATPTIDGDRVYDETPRGDLTCMDARTGRIIWAKNILEQYEGEMPKWALAESVVIDGDRLICCPFGKKASIVALDKTTGNEVWKAAPIESPTAGYATPLLIEQDGLRIVLSMSGKSLVGVNADSGELLFTFAHATNYDVNATQPIYHDGRIFISSGYGTTGSKQLGLKVEGEKASVSELWHSKDLDNHHGGVILLDGYLYGASHNFNSKKPWVCLDWNDGKLMYAEEGVGKGSLTFADGNLITMSEKRAVGLVKATPDGHEVISRFEIPNQGKGASWAHPVVCGGRLYIRHGDYLYCYDISGK